MTFQDNSLVRSQASILATNTVLRNTYLLLGLTLVFSGLMAALAMFTDAPPMNPILLLVGYIGLLLLTNALRNSVWGLVSVFAFTGFMGYTLGPILNLYIATFSNGAQLIGTTLGGTGLLFFGLSAYVLTTQKDFSYLGGFLFIAMITVLVASIAALFFSVPFLYIMISAFMVLITSGLILFDTSRIINGGETNYISATIQLYVDIYMLFVNLLQLLSSLSGNRN